MKHFVTIGKFLPSPKDLLDVSENTGIIYQVPFVYIGKIKGDLKSQLSEHKRGIKYQRPEKSAVCEHSITLGHIIDRNEATIFSPEKDYTKRLYAESWLINKSSKVINRNDKNTLLPFTKNYCNLRFLQLHSIFFTFSIVLLLSEYVCCFL